MSGVAIIGAGEVGGAIAHALAGRGRVNAITLVDDAELIARGKALDLRQSGPIDRVDVRLDGSADLLSVAGADVIVLADAVSAGEWHGEGGLAIMERLMRAGTTAPLVCAGPNQVSLMTLAARELEWPVDRLIGSAGSALVGTTRALVGLEVGGSGVGVSVTVTGCPPRAVVAWSCATVDGSLAIDRIPAHRLRAVSQTLGKLWPPSPRAIAAPTARIVEALIQGARTLHQAIVILDGEFELRGVAGMLPLALGSRRILERLIPSLSPQERTEAVTAFSA